MDANLIVDNIGKNLSEHLSPDQPTQPSGPINHTIPYMETAYIREMYGMNC